ncbi:MAG: tyrosine-type recombinase/integrase [Acidobacteria bacterium]|nr:tyrosine-type recombinase/integrase [Acidobacteriota bacterium]MDA1235966.1 tyrosine-type recombinase/integrase [Acidobacteriota bacterium]
MNDELYDLLVEHRNWFELRFGPVDDEYFLFPFGTPQATDPTRPITTIKKGWTRLKQRAKVECRFHDLRHTVATNMTEAGIAESTMLAVMGHMSRAMLERYSHVRLAAKRDAVRALGTTTINESQKQCLQNPL